MLLNSILQQKCIKNKWMPADVNKINIFLISLVIIDL
jgi:hypothetical protein